MAQKASQWAFLLAFVSTAIAGNLRADVPRGENPAAPAERLTVMINGRLLSERWHRVQIGDFRFIPVRYLVLPPSKALEYLENARRNSPKRSYMIRFYIQSYRGHGEWVTVYHPAPE